VRSGCIVGSGGGGLVFGISAAERWRSIRVTEFERRQMAALRQEFDHDYEVQVGLQPTRSERVATTKIPSKSRT
jgi:putative transposase